MHKIFNGIQSFQQDIFETQRGLFERLTNGQHPMALFITCSDSRINPNLITQTEPGDLFIMRNAGNIVPPYGAGSGGGEAATIEFAVAALKVPDIIVCGHSHCGAMKALIGPDSALADMPATRTWLGNAEATRRIVRDKYAHTKGDRQLSVCIEENVLVQIENLRTHPFVAAGIARRTLNLHAWVYHFQTGGVSAYDSASASFAPLANLAALGAVGGYIERHRTFEAVSRPLGAS